MNNRMLNKIFHEYNFYMSKRSNRPKAPEEYEYQALQPMLKKLPPKEIISEKYMPDADAPMKLVTNRDLRRNNISFVPPKTRDNELQTYVSHFNKLDYLGHYCSDAINQVVYLKFNNTKYNSVPGAAYKTRIMPAFYVPFHQIYSEDEDIFTKNLGLKFPETHEKSLLPSSKYHRGCAFDPIFCSTYLNGNLFAVIRKQPYQYELFLQNDVNSSLQVGWFNFSVEFYQIGYYTFRIKNMTKNMAKLFQKGLKINFLLHSAVSQEAKKQIGEDWSLAGENIAFTKTDVEIESRPGEYYYELYFEYRCKNKHDIGIFSLDVPYNPVDCEKFFNNAIYNKVKGLTRIEKIEYGRTISGTPLSAYLIKKKKAGSDTDQLSAQITQALLHIKNRRSVNLAPINKMFLPDQAHIRSIVVIGRLAGSDINSSHMIQGMVEYLLDTLDFESMKRQINFYFIPMANADSVKYGTTIANLTGSNLIHDWRNTNKIYQAQIHSLKDFLINTNKKYPISAIMSLSTQNEELYSSVVGAKTESEDSEDSRIFPYVLSKRSKMFSFENSYFYEKKASDHMCCFLGELFPKAQTYQFNICRFQLVRQPEQNIENVNLNELQVKQCSIESYRSIGRQILSNYLQHIKMFEKNSLLRDRWTREIQDIQSRIIRKEPRLIFERPVEERFHEKFYQIKPHHEAPSITDIRGTHLSQSHKSDKQSNKFLQLAKIFQIPFMNEINSPKALPKKVMQKYRKKNNESSVGSSIIQDQNDRESEGEKNRKNLFRIEEKKSPAVLKAFSPNTFNFEFGGTPTPSKHVDSPYSEKEKLKKDLSTKMLKKVRLEDAFKDKYARGRFASP